jgi:hypothetical protein
VGYLVRKNISLLLIFVLLTTFSSSAFAATIGSPLLTPEAGWKRLDQRSVGIMYNGSWSNLGFVHAPSYGGSYAYTSSSSATIQFKFTGTQVRIIARKGDHTYTTQAEFLVDGVLKGSYSNTGDLTAQVLMAEALGLSNGVHEAIIRVKSGATSGLNLDAIDIDTSGNIVDLSTPVEPVEVVPTAPVKLLDLVQGGNSINAKLVIVNYDQSKSMDQSLIFPYEYRKAVK